MGKDLYLGRWTLGRALRPHGVWAAGGITGRLMRRAWPESYKWQTSSNKGQQQAPWQGSTWREAEEQQQWHSSSGLDLWSSSAGDGIAAGCSAAAVLAAATGVLLAVDPMEANLAYLYAVAGQVRSSLGPVEA